MEVPTESLPGRVPCTISLQGSHAESSSSPEEPAHANSTFKGLSYHPGVSHAELKRRITGEQRTDLIEETSPIESFETPLLGERKGRVYVGIFSIL
jgi:hypothetical protein